MKRPAWAAAGCFAQAWANALAAQVQAWALDNLARGRVVVVKPEQVEVLPEFPSWGDEQEFSRELRLPFEHLFLDLGGTALLEDDRITAARAVQISSAAGSDRFEGLMWADLLPHKCVCVAEFAIDSHGTLRVDALAEPVHPAMPKAVTPDELVRAVATRCWSRCLAVLSWLESVNVELAEAPLSARQRRREVTKGRQIASVIQVRAPKSKAVGRNGRANYSHRFEVRGHYMHFDESTKIGAADPTKLSFVPGRGFVRKVWCPPHVKGPEDKPLIPKVRVIASEGGSL